MFILKKKKVITLVTSYVLAACVVLGGFIYTNHQTAKKYKILVDQNYQHAFSELVTCMSEIDSALQKGLYSTSPSMVCSVCTQVFGKAMSAQMALGVLPFDNNELANTASFVTKVGDYAYMLSKSAASGSGYTDEQLQNLSTLSQSASVLSQNLIDLYADLSAGRITMEKLHDAQDSTAKTGDVSVPSSLQESFKLMEGEFPEVPSLIYDGPFSEHIEKMEPKLLADKNEVSENEALKAASSMTGIPPDSFESCGQRNGKLPVYTFCADLNGEYVYAEVTIKGGVVSYWGTSRITQTANISAEKGVTIAEDFLKKHGYPSLETSYWMVQNNTVTVNFAYSQDGVICYPDLIKVSVSLDDGKVCGIESLGYIMSHCERQIPEVKISAEDAQKNVALSLTILSHNLAIIPTDGKYEVFCHEFKCKSNDGRHYIIYINAETGIEENVLILVEDENGTLTL